MANDCKHTEPCGCADVPLMTPPPCETGTDNCPAPDPCPETFCDDCVVHCGDTIVDTNVMHGERLTVTLQRLSLFLTNPTCILPGATCTSPLGLKSTAITSTTVDIAWLTTGAANYRVEYKLASAISWTLSPLYDATKLSEKIIGLNPDEAYHIRVISICGAEACESVTILINTKQ